MDENLELLKYPLLYPLFNYQVLDELRKQLSVANYLAAPNGLPQEADHTFYDNESLWDAILSERLRASVTIKLENFLLFEWFPRSPGLFHTRRAQEARHMAMNYTIPYEISPHLKEIDDASVYGKGKFMPDYMRIFDPYGKIQMLEGGIGSVRLKDKTIDAGQVWFMTASSTLAAHEGFPIALPDIYYQKTIDQIATKGSAECTLVGKLRFVPDQLSTLYEDFTGVPQVYLLVDEVEPSNRQLSEKGAPRVSVAVTFRSEHYGGGSIFASYVTFFPGEPGSLTSRVDWLEDIYVKSMYQGQILTDFDEQNRRFENARFSLKKVLAQQVSMAEAENWVREVNVFGSPMMIIEGLTSVHAERVAHMTQEKVITIGEHNTISAPITIADQIENSFNMLKGAGIEAEVKQLLEQLLNAVNEVNKQAPVEKAAEAEAMARDAEALLKEATSSQPRRRWYEVSLEGLKEAAKNIGEIADPVLGIVQKLMPLLLAAV